MRYKVILSSMRYHMSWIRLSLFITTIMCIVLYLTLSHGYRIISLLQLCVSYRIVLPNFIVLNIVFDSKTNILFVQFMQPIEVEYTNLGDSRYLCPDCLPISVMESTQLKLFIPQVYSFFHHHLEFHIKKDPSIFFICTNQIKKICADHKKSVSFLSKSLIFLKGCIPTTIHSSLSRHGSWLWPDSSTISKCFTIFYICHLVSLGLSWL